MTTEMQIALYGVARVMDETGHDCDFDLMDMEEMRVPWDEYDPYEYDTVPHSLDFD